jgi:anaerobic ribonucleoside-triphosphate reductase activating protein
VSVLRINDVRYPVTTLGPGRRLGIWVQGCPLACPGCMSRDTWDPAGGRRLTVGSLARLWRLVSADGADGLTVSGGEPLDQAGPLAELLAARPAEGTGDVLLYTGYEPAEAEDRGADALAGADAVITGRFEIGRPTNRIWRGSANQRLIPLTDLGRRRYEAYLEYEPAHAELDVRCDGRIIGVPRSGDLQRLEAGLRSRGIIVREATWRPVRRNEAS